jgi:hypothetical protein
MPAGAKKHQKRFSSCRVRLQVESSTSEGGNDVVVVPTNLDVGREDLTGEEKKLMWWESDMRRQVKLDAITFIAHKETDDGSSPISHMATFRQATMELCSTSVVAVRALL